MTRKQALYKALETVADEAVKMKLWEILEDMPFGGWSEGAIFDAIDQFVADNGRVPHISDFRKRGLPPHTVIKLRFDMSLKEFLTGHYPSARLCPSRLYFHKTKEDWKGVFAGDYIKNRPGSAEGHNRARTKGTPSWQTISVMFGIRKWSEWLEFCGLEAYRNRAEKSRHSKSPLVLTSHNDMFVKFEDLGSKV